MEKLNCSTFPHRRASFLCTVPNCPLQFFCDSLGYYHRKNCTHSFQKLNIESVKRKGDIQDYFDIAKIDFLNPKQQINEIYRELQTFIEKIIQNFKMDSIKRLISEGKEYRLKRITNEINLQHSKCKGIYV